VRRIFLLGAAAELSAVQAAAPALFGVQVVVPQPADYAAIGAARQAAWALRVSQGTPDPRTPPVWQGAGAPGPEPGDELAGGAAGARRGADASGGVPRLGRAPSYGSPGVVPVRVRPLRHLPQPRSVRGP